MALIKTNAIMNFKLQVSMGYTEAFEVVHKLFFGTVDE